MNTSLPSDRTAVIGAGLAGAACARLLADAGHAVTVFDKSRGAGGRMATRRAEWTDAVGRPRQTRFDHGTPGFVARSPDFQQAVNAARAAGWLGLAAAFTEPGRQQDAAIFVGQPDMPQWCRGLLQGLPAFWGEPVQALERGVGGWRVQRGDAWGAEVFGRVVLAMPPLQAAALLAPHRPDWAQRAALVPMQPCWTLMAVAASGAPVPLGPELRPAQGPLARVLRQDGRAGREALPGESHWVAHARADWNAQHLEDPPEAARAALLSALTVALSTPVEWLHAVVHRWRYALPPARSADAPAEPCWWDAGLGLGACGDFFAAGFAEAAGGHGVEAAWCSARALAAQCTASTATQEAPAHG